MKYTKIFNGERYIEKFVVDDKRIPLRKRLENRFKLYLWRTAKLCVIAWMVVGGLTYGEMKSQASIVYADHEVIKEVPAELIAPVMERIAQCESGKNQTDPKTGQVLMRYNPASNSMDIGYFQINETYNGKQATKEGYDLTKKEDNIAFAYELYKQRGTEPWSASKACWNK